MCGRDWSADVCSSDQPAQTIPQTVLASRAPKRSLSQPPETCNPRSVGRASLREGVYVAVDVVALEGILCADVTGVQTCALPINPPRQFRRPLEPAAPQNGHLASLRKPATPDKPSRTRKTPSQAGTSPVRTLFARLAPPCSH